MMRRLAILLAAMAIGCANSSGPEVSNVNCEGEATVLGYLKERLKTVPESALSVWQPKVDQQEQRARAMGCDL